ncbi:sigma-70 family RNA polymerase sigma factor [Schinkia azotoformans]|uniref:sigma-70 family RNA polymerase sigma factor n=1 Tax=Schinkia azotoformans TaxID=1454 RepID=UPI002DBA75F9|nr:sigma-70 family RNA polymerase sigma factor [Schinkia azotoformans]MEC1720072.1 sigma-70 family RNA polymerase sigma factor [Schinkia azotoformans]MED4414213.1 sigma-70 family RNA polymerase sigma factor [Schinkia azotoformans]
MKKAQKGNDKAFLKLFQQYEENIYRMAFIYVNNKDDALDVVQEVAYQSFKKIHTLKKPEYFKTWLIKITMNCAINLAKKNKKVVQLKPEFEEFIGLEDEDIPLSLSLQELIETLQEDEKSIVLLRYYNDCTFKEISDLLNIPLGTAKSVLYRALDKLRKKYKEGDICER